MVGSIGRKMMESMVSNKIYGMKNKKIIEKSNKWKYKSKIQKINIRINNKKLF